MAGMQTLHDAFLDELRDAYDAERQLTKALPRLARVATSIELRQAFTDHLKETQGHVRKLERVFQSLDEKARGVHCEGIAGIIEEGKHVIAEDVEGATLDACLIAAGQRAEHYEMAAYGTLVAWARSMKHAEAAGLLEEILEEEKAADETLTAIAESSVNAEAASGARDEDREEQAEARPRRSAAAAASRRTPRRRK